MGRSYGDRDEQERRIKKIPRRKRMETNRRHNKVVMRDPKTGEYIDKR